MSIDFFQTPCSEDTCEKRFGIRDGIGGEPAYIDIEEEDKWVAVIDNENGNRITFHAIDHCIELKDEQGNLKKRCDAMLTYTGNIVFLELKEVRTGSWISGGIEQLKSCIHTFSQHHDLSVFRKRRAFLANSRHPSFKHAHKETMERFRAETSVRLIIHNHIKV